MTYLVNYSKFKRLTEQSTQSATPINFLITAGTTTVPARDKRLNELFAFPLPENSTETSVTLYELTLAQVQAGQFQNAKIISRVNDNVRDQIKFGGESLTMRGSLPISWTPADMSKIIQVSGNGALILTRVFDAFKQMGSITPGVVVLKFEVPIPYNDFASIKSLRIDEANIRSMIRGLMDYFMVSITEPSTSAELSKKWGYNSTTFKLAFANTAPFGFYIKKDGTSKKYSPEKTDNPAMSEHYGKYSRRDLLTDRENHATLKLRDICKSLKTSIIDPGLTNLANYLPQGLSSALSGVDQQYIDRFASQGQSTILNAKNAITLNEIVEFAKSVFISEPKGPGQAPVGQAATGKTTYNPKTLAKE